MDARLPSHGIPRSRESDRAQSRSLQQQGKLQVHNTKSANNVHRVRIESEFNRTRSFRNEPPSWQKMKMKNNDIQWEGKANWLQYCSRAWQCGQSGVSYVIALKKQLFPGLPKWGRSQWSLPDTVRLTCSVGGGEGG